MGVRKFKVGDVVIAKGNMYGGRVLLKGGIGRVVSIGYKNYGVEFRRRVVDTEGRFVGHSCDGAGEDTFCYYVGARLLELYEEDFFGND